MSLAPNAGAQPAELPVETEAPAAPSLDGAVARAKKNAVAGAKAVKVFEALAEKPAKKGASAKDKDAVKAYHAFMVDAAARTRKLVARARKLIARAEKEQGILIEDLNRVNDLFKELKGELQGESLDRKTKTPALAPFHDQVMTTLKAVD